MNHSIRARLITEYRESLSLWNIIAALLFIYLCVGPFFSDVLVFITGWLAIIIISTVALRKRHGADVNIILITFFATTYISTVIFLAFDRILFSGGGFGSLGITRSVDDTNWLVKIVHLYMETSIDIPTEFLIIVVLLGAVVVPQVLSYLVCGVFGCARQPIWVTKAIKFAILNFVKALCVFAGLVIGSAIFDALTSDRTTADKILSIIFEALPAWYGLAAAFLLTLIYREIEFLQERLQQSKKEGLLKKITSKMNRHVKEDPAEKEPLTLSLGTYSVTYQFDKSFYE